MGAPASPPFLLMACIYHYLGWGSGRKRSASKVEHRGQDGAASALGFLEAMVLVADRAGLLAATWSPFSRVTWGLPSAFEMSGQRALLLQSRK